MNPSIENLFWSSGPDRQCSETPVPAPSQVTARPENSVSGLSTHWQSQAVGQETLRQRIAFNQLTTLRNGLEADLEDYVSHDVPAIGLNWRKLSRYGIRKSVRLIRRSGLKVSSLGWIGGFTGEHGYPQADMITEGKRLIRVASQLRAETVTVVSGPQGGHIRSHAMRIVGDALAELAEFSELHGVRLCLQPMHALFARGWTFVHSLDDALALLDRAGHPGIQLALGAYHHWEEAGLLSRVAALSSRIGLVTLADWGDAPRHENDRLLPGEGRLPLSEFVQTLELSGFSGWYELEVWSQDLWKLERRDLMRRCVAARDRLAAQFAIS